MGILRGVIFFVLLALGVVFAIQNDQPVSIRYYFNWISPPLPLFLWVFAALLVGIIFSGAMAYLSKFGLYARIRQHRKSIADLEAKLNELREGKPQA